MIINTNNARIYFVYFRFNNCPDDAVEPTVQRFTRVWIWHMLGSFLFPDAAGDSISWVWVPLLGDFEAIGSLSWASAGLAWLYRNLCDACRQSAASSNFGGCSLLLQVWIWKRFLVGRPDREIPQVSKGSHFSYVRVALRCYSD